MNDQQPKKQTRHGKRAPGKTQTSITLNEDLLARAKEAAAKDGRSLSNWLEQLVRRSVLLLCAAFTAFHLTRTPSDWSQKALVKTGKAAWSLIGRALA